MDDVFLSIDLDYWCRMKQARRFLESVLALDVPAVIVKEHDLLVPYVNKSGCNTLINIDYHDDLVGREKLVGLEEGSWVSHVRWAKKGRYIWCYPNRSSLSDGICDCDFNLWKDNKSPWPSISRHKGILFDSTAVRYIGISLSYFWWRGSTESFEQLMAWLKNTRCARSAKTFKEPWRLGSTKAFEQLMAWQWKRSVGQKCLRNRIRKGWVR